MVLDGNQIALKFQSLPLSSSMLQILEANKVLATNVSCVFTPSTDSPNEITGKDRAFIRRFDTAYLRLGNVKHIGAILREFSGTEIHATIK
jgi:hypothetical protein